MAARTSGTRSRRSSHSVPDSTGKARHAMSSMKIAAETTAAVPRMVRKDMWQWIRSSSALQ